MIIESQVSLTGQIQIAIDLFQLCWLTLKLTQTDDLMAEELQFTWNRIP